VEPLVLFTTEERRARYLGSLKTIPPSARWDNIRTQEVELPDVSQRTSSRISLSSALDLLGPFIDRMLQITGVNLAASVNASRHGDVGARITRSRTKRSFVQPLACASAIAAQTLPFPRDLALNFEPNGEFRLYLVDSVLSARQITITIEGDSSSEVTAKLESELAGKVSANSILSSASRFVITGAKRAPFAFTCLAVDLNRRSEIVGLHMPKILPRLGLSGVQAITPIQHASLGDANELLAFD
jgi:hypothetical protein